ncbi:hypothetical protein S40288_00922, partial [Stachybotrys chartarum IBT 40288]
CDESRPICQRCAKAGYVCDYSASAPSLQIDHPGTVIFDLNNGLSAPNPHIRLPVIMMADGSSSFYELQKRDLAALSRFRERTAWTMGDGRVRQQLVAMFEELGKTVSLGYLFRNTYLLHAFLAVSLIHDTCLSPAHITPEHRASTVFHWYQATTFFHRKLKTVACNNQSEIDSLWVAATLVGTASLGYLDTSDATKVWPLKDQDATDLNWLKLNEGKRAVMEIVHARSDTFSTMRGLIKGPLPRGNDPIEPKLLPKGMYGLLDLDDPSSPTTNPYFSSASILAQILPLEPHDNNVLSFLAFIRQEDPSLRNLLQVKDHRAMLLLAHYFAKVANHSLWWFGRRATVEGIAICLYLEHNCEDDRVLELLTAPRATFAKRAEGRRDAIVVDIQPPR